MFLLPPAMLAHIYNEAELAGVLAHEIAHVVKKHHLEAIRKKSRAGLIADLTAIAVQTGESAYNRRQVEEGTGKRSDSSDEVTEKMDAVVTDLYSRGLDREDEFEADRMALVIAARAGYDSFAFASVLQLLGSRKPDDSVLLTFLKVHPNIGERLARIEPILEQLADYQENSRVLASRYRTAIR